MTTKQTRWYPPEHGKCPHCSAPITDIEESIVRIRYACDAVMEYPHYPEPAQPVQRVRCTRDAAVNPSRSRMPRYPKSEAAKQKRANWLASAAGQKSQADRMERYWRKRLGLAAVQQYCQQVLDETREQLSWGGAPGTEAQGRSDTAWDVLKLLRGNTEET